VYIGIYTNCFFS